MKNGIQTEFNQQKSKADFESMKDYLKDYFRADYFGMINSRTDVAIDGLLMGSLQARTMTDWRAHSYLKRRLIWVISTVLLLHYYFIGKASLPVCVKMMIGF